MFRNVDQGLGEAEERLNSDYCVLFQFSDNDNFVESLKRLKKPNLKDMAQYFRCHELSQYLERNAVSEGEHVVALLHNLHEHLNCEGKVLRLLEVLYNYHLSVYNIACTIDTADINIVKIRCDSHLEDYAALLQKYV